MGKKTEYVHQNEVLWAVRIDGTGGPGLALNGEGGRALFRHKDGATKFSDELQTHIESPCSPIEVNVTFDEIRF